MSVREPGYDWELGRSLDFFVNGIKQDRVIAYDMDAGWLLRIETTPDGKCVANGDHVSEETVTGEVTVKRRAD